MSEIIDLVRENWPIVAAGSAIVVGGAEATLKPFRRAWAMLRWIGAWDRARLAGKYERGGWVAKSIDLQNLDMRLLRAFYDSREPPSIRLYSAFFNASALAVSFRVEPADLQFDLRTGSNTWQPIPTPTPIRFSGQDETIPAWAAREERNVPLVLDLATSGVLQAALAQGVVRVRLLTRVVAQIAPGQSVSDRFTMQALVDSE